MKMSARQYDRLHEEMAPLARDMARLAKRYAVAPSTIARHALLLANPLHRGQG